MCTSGRVLLLCLLGLGAVFWFKTWVLPRACNGGFSWLIALGVWHVVFAGNFGFLVC